MKKIIKWFARNSFLKAAFIWAVVAVLLALSADRYLIPKFAGQSIPKAEVPNVTGLDENVADSILTSAGFRVKWNEEGRYSEQVPAGVVLVQFPAAGHVSKLGRSVNLTKSLGLHKVEIPDLRGKSQKQTLITLTRAGLVPGEIIKGAHQDIPKDVVIRTIPQAGTIARVGDTVQIVISAGETGGKALLPNFEGRILDDVYPELENLGFKVGKITRKENDQGLPPGTILKTSPKYGDYLPPETKIDFVVAD